MLYGLLTKKSNCCLNVTTVAGDMEICQCHMVMNLVMASPATEERRPMDSFPRAYLPSKSDGQTPSITGDIVICQSRVANT